MSVENNFPAPEQVESTEETEKFKKWEESLRNKTIDELEAQADYVEGRLGSEHAALTNEINRRKTEEEAGGWLLWFRGHYKKFRTFGLDLNISKNIQMSDGHWKIIKLNHD